MLLEAVLYFVLGFFSAGLLALMISPAIWNRAVVLTKNRIQSSVPLTLNEIQADKDQLRAEFAMSTRRLEISVDELKERASAQLIEINRKRDEIKKYDLEMAERQKNLNQLEKKQSIQLDKITKSDQLLVETLAKQDELEKQYVATLEELNNLKYDLSLKEMELSNQKIELVARDTKLETLLSKEFNEEEGDDDEDKAIKIKLLKKQLATERSKLKSERLKFKQGAEEIKFARGEYQDLMSTLGKRETSLKETREQNKYNARKLSETERSLMDEKEKALDLEARLANQTLKLEAVLSDASDENVRVALAGIKEHISDNKEALASLVNERDELQSNLNMVTSTVDDNWSNERQENAILRERINDMAAQIAAMTASLEGSSSQINEILDAKPAKAKKISKAEEISGGKSSLAARIKAIQETTGS